MPILNVVDRSNQPLRNLIDRASRGKLETFTAAQGLQQLSQYQASDDEFALPIDIAYEVQAPVAIIGSGPTLGAGVIIYLEWGYASVVHRRAFLAAFNPVIGAGGFNKVSSAPFHGRVTVVGTWARVAAVIAFTASNLITNSVTVFASCAPSVGGPNGEPNRLTVWGSTNQTDAGTVNQLLIPPISGAFDPNNLNSVIFPAAGIAQPLKLARLSGYNYGTVAAFPMLFDQSTTANPPNPVAGRYCPGNVPPGGAFSIDTQLSGIGFETGCCFIPSATPDHWTAPAAGANFRIDYEIFVV